TYDLVIANAFLDIVDYRAALPGLRDLARPGGRLLFSITFDGLTSFEPEIDRELDDRIVATYHRTMDERFVDGRPFGDSRCGRHLFGALPTAGLRIAAAGASDWVVVPVGGRYPADEAYFLGRMLAFFEEALSVRPEIGKAELRVWLERRRAQLGAAELCLIVHQLDVLAQRP
ncbi:MAG TPA: class I SAM-dependent methyltransferase, partial [Spirochaetia bacterium]|nr:class I SAM-dependent methyltransferase [Spirochaetia bacterium]